MYPCRWKMKSRVRNEGVSVFLTFQECLLTLLFLFFFSRLFSHPVFYLSDFCWGAHPYLGSGAGTVNQSRRNNSVADMSAFPRFVYSCLIKVLVELTAIETGFTIFLLKQIARFQSKKSVHRTMLKTVLKSGLQLTSWLLCQLLCWSS